MKKLYFTLFFVYLLSISIYAKAQDINKDGYQDEDVSVVQNILKNKNISWDDYDYSTLEGIKWNDDTPKRISHIDLAEQSLVGALDISSCVKLEELVLSGNNITSLNISGCILLKRLNCSYNNIKSINLTNCISLKYLYCTNNLLRKINTSDCTNLIDIKLDKNIIEYFDLSTNKLLEQLDISYNILVELDLSDNIKLKEIDCSNNTLKNIDVRNLNILNILDCSYNNLSDINLSNNTKLKNIRCNNNKLVTIDIVNNNNLLGLICNNNLITKIEISPLNKLNSISCSSNKLKELNFSICKELLFFKCANNKLSSLDLSAYNKLSYIFCLGNMIPFSKFNRGTLSSIDKMSQRGVFYDNKYYTFPHQIDYSSEDIIGGVQSTFKWYRYGKEIDGALSSTYTATEAGSYSCSILNKSFTDYELNTSPVNIYSGDEPISIGTDYLEVIRKSKNGTSLGKIISHFGDSFMPTTSFPMLISYTIDDKHNSLNIDERTGEIKIIDIDKINSLQQKQFTITVNLDNGIIPTISKTVMVNIIETDVNNDAYNDEDVNVLKNILKNNTNLTWQGDNYSSYQGIIWNTDTPKRIIEINLKGKNIKGDLDVSSCEKLLSLNVENNNIDALKIYKCTELEQLNCSYNNIRSLKLDENGKLLNLNCSNNILSILNLYNCGDLIELDFSHNKLSTINISSTREISFLKCNNNNLPFAQLVKIKGVRYLRSIPQNKVYYKRIINVNTLIDCNPSKSKHEANSVFRWYKNGTIIENQNSSKYTPGEKGQYYCEITNSYIRNLTLTSNTITVIESNLYASEIVSSQTFSIKSDYPVNKAIGVVQTTDKDPTDDALIFSMDSNIFNIDKNTGTITLKKANSLDDQLETTYRINVSINDNKHDVYTAPIIIIVGQKDEAPTDILLSNTIIFENKKLGEQCAVISTIDKNSNERFTYSIKDNYYLEIKGDKLILKSKLHFSSKRSFNVIITVSDKANLRFTKEFTFNVAAINYAPNDITLDNYSTPENYRVGRLISRMYAHDNNRHDSFTFSVEENDLCEVDDNILIYKNSPNFEEKNEYNIVITVVDSGGLSFTKHVRIKITDVNDTPSDILFSSQKVNENTAVGSVVATLEAVDDDKIDSFTYSIVSNKYFYLEGDKLILKQKIDFEYVDKVYIYVTVTDKEGRLHQGGRFIEIVDVNEAPVDIYISNNKIDNNSDNSSALLSFTSADSDKVDRFTYSIAENDNFEIRGNKLFLKKKFTLQTANTTSITVSTLDKDNLCFTKDFELEIRNSPTDIILSVYSINENNSYIQINLSTVDKDENEDFTYYTKSKNKVRISGDILRLDKLLNYELYKTIDFDITVRDKYGFKFTKQIHLTINDINEKPTNISISNNTISENVEIGTALAIINAEDPDADEEFTYSIIHKFQYHYDGNDFFEVKGNKLILKNRLHNRKSDNIKVGIVVTDKGGLSYTKKIIITVVTVNEAPTDISLSTYDINEDAKTGFAFAIINTDDFDADETFTYSISDNNYFEIKDDKLILKTKLDYENQLELVFDITVNDKDNLSFVKSFQINIIDVNEAPTVINVSNTSIAEGNDKHSEIAILTSKDVDIDDTFTYTIVYNDYFYINKDKLCSKYTFDFEMQNVFNISILVSDKGGLIFRKAVRINIIDVNESPRLISLSNKTVSEDTDIDSEIATLSTLDPDKDDTFVYTIEDNDFFYIKNGKLYTKAKFDYGNKEYYEIIINVSDKAGLKISRVFTIQITHVNKQPTDITLSNNNISENSDIDYPIAIISTIDNDANDTFTYSIRDNNFFYIQGNNLFIKANIDFETQNIFDIEITVRDKEGLSLSKIFQISINDVNEAPINITISNEQIDENTPLNSFIATLWADDNDNNDVFMYSVSNKDFFYIYEDKLYLKQGVDFETQNVFDIDITVSDKGGLTYTKSFHIKLNDINEAPSDISLSNNDINEDAPIDSIIGVFTTTDEDNGDSFTFEIEENDNFVIHENELRTKSKLYFAKQAFYKIIIKTIDKDGETYTKQFIINIGISTGIDDINKLFETQIFPNPVSDILNVHMQGVYHITYLTLVNMSGKLIFEEKVYPSNGEISLSKNIKTLNTGVYMLIVKHEHKTQSYKIIKM